MKAPVPLPGTRPVTVTVQGRELQIQTDQPDTLSAAVQILEGTFQDMDSQCQLRWGSVPKGLDTPSWYLLGALNLAHRVVRLEQEANQHTHNLEQTLSKLLSDVPDEPSAPVPLLDEDGD
jgi:cell division protein ZapA (FtsZ GTPase activity inhibitor)